MKSRDVPSRSTWHVDRLPLPFAGAHVSHRHVALDRFAPTAMLTERTSAPLRET